MIKVFTIYKDVKDMKGVKCPGEGKSLEKILNEKVLSCKINEKNCRYAETRSGTIP